MYKLLNGSIVVGVVLALAAGTAQARPPSEGFMFKNGKGQHAVSVRGKPVPRGVPCLAIAGNTSNGEQGSGDPSNTVVNLNIGVGNSLTGVAVDATITAHDPSWLSETQLTFSSSDAKDPNGITFTPSQTDEPGEEVATTEGVIMFADIPLGDIPVGADGILRLEWAEGFNDPEVDPDNTWSASTAPNVCQGLRLICTNQAACDATVPVMLQQFNVD